MTPFIGQIQIFGFGFAPRGWAFCDGQLLPIAQYTALFSLLGTTYGGDGRTTFGLPDLRGRVPVHVGNGPGLASIRWGEKSGRENVTLTVNNLPAHNHPVNANADPGDQAGPAGTFPAGSKADGRGTVDTPYAGSGGAQMNAGMIGNAGGSQAFNIRNPFVGMYYCIALEGVYPSRS